VTPKLEKCSLKRKLNSTVNFIKIGDKLMTAFWVDESDELI